LLCTGSIANDWKILFTNNCVLSTEQKPVYSYVLYIWEIHCRSVHCIVWKWNVTDALPFHCILLGFVRNLSWSYAAFLQESVWVSHTRAPSCLWCGVEYYTHSFLNTPIKNNLVLIMWGTSWPWHITKMGETVESQLSDLNGTDWQSDNWKCHNTECWWGKVHNSVYDIIKLQRKYSMAANGKVLMSDELHRVLSDSLSLLPQYSAALGTLLWASAPLMTCTLGLGLCWSVPLPLSSSISPIIMLPSAASVQNSY
jgi:hypothetical protein